MRLGLAIWPKSAAGWIKLGLGSLPGVQVDFIGADPVPGAQPYDLLVIDGDNPGPHYLNYARAYQAKFGEPQALILGTTSSPAVMFIEWAPERTQFIAKPCRIEEVREAVEHVARSRQAPELPTTVAPASAGVASSAVQLGYLSTLTLSDLLQMLCLNGWTGRIEVENVRNGSKGFVYLSGGTLLHAETVSGLRGELACYDMLAWPRSVFQFLENCAAMAPSIQTSWQNVLMDAARVRDERQNPPLAASA